MDENKVNVLPNTCYPCYAKAIPVAFDESLTYLEQVSRLLYKINELIPIVNHNSEVVSQIDANFTDIYNQLETLKNEINEINNYFPEFEESVKEQVAGMLKDQWSQVLALINNYVAEIYKYIDNYNENFKNEIEKEIEKIYDYIDEIKIGKIEVYDPTTGKNGYINDVINNIYEMLRYNAIACIEFDTSGITAKGFDSLNMSALDFDTNARNYILRVNQVLNPFTGDYVSFQEMFNYLARFHMSGITCEKFDGLELTAEEYDLKEITAYQFDVANPLNV